MTGSTSRTPASSCWTGTPRVRPGLSVISTPGHTSGHQSVLVAAADGGADLLIGDAAYTPRQYRPEPGPLPPGQAADEDSWHASVNRMRALSPARVHFCHHTDVMHG
jgi:N-acyl homoserine lactone hydrolase